MDESLPTGCDRCHGASHVVGTSGGAERCGCDRGRRLLELDKTRRAARHGVAPGSPGSVGAERQRNASKARKRASAGISGEKERGLFDD